MARGGPPTDPKRRHLLGAATALALWPQAPRAEGSAPKRITWALNLPPEEARKRRDPHDRIRNSLRSRGLTEGRDFTLTFVGLPLNQKEKADELADQLIGSGTQIIVMHAHLALWSLRSRTRTIPVVFYDLSGDPSKTGLVESLRRPGVNFTGAYFEAGEYSQRLLQLLKQLVPSLTRAGNLVSKETWEAFKDVRANPALEEHKRVAKAQLGIELVDVVVSGAASPAEIEATLRASRIQSVNVTALSPREREIFRAATSKFPTCSLNFAAARAGALIGIGRDHWEGMSYAVEAVHRILRGDDPATIPVYRNTKLAIAINRATARRLGIEIPASVLTEALEIYD